jgi:hypothetical protein
MQIKKAWITTTIFTEFLRALDASMGVQGRNILLFVDNCAAHPQDTLFLRNVKVVYYPPNCTSMLQPLDLGTIKCFKQFLQEAPSAKSCVLDGLREGRRTENHCFASDTFHSSSLVISHAVINSELFSSVWLWV